MTDKQNAIIFGVGPGLGTALFQKFESEGLCVFGVARTKKSLLINVYPKFQSMKTITFLGNFKNV